MGDDELVIRTIVGLVRDVLLGSLGVSAMYLPTGGTVTSRLQGIVLSDASIEDCLLPPTSQ